MNWKRTGIIVLGSGWFFLASCTAGLAAGSRIVAAIDARDASSGDELHTTFSVVIVSDEDHAEFTVIDLDHATNHTDSIDTFLMPKPGDSRNVGGSRFSYAVIEDRGSSQVIEVVQDYNDGDNTIWSVYEATADEVRPISSRMFYMGYMFAAAPYAVGFAIVLLVTGRVLRAQNRQLFPAGETPGPGKKYEGWIFIGIFGASLAAMYYLTTPTETRDFTGTTARYFTVAGIVTGDSAAEGPYRVFNLQGLESGQLDLSEITFLLPQQSITINVGDIHRAEILEDHGSWQKVAFHYSNTRTASAIYRAYADRVEPVSYRVTSSVGHLPAAIFLLLIALFLTWIISAVMNWHARRAK